MHSISLYIYLCLNVYHNLNETLKCSLQFKILHLHHYLSQFETILAGSVKGKPQVSEGTMQVMLSHLTENVSQSFNLPCRLRQLPHHKYVRCMMYVWCACDIV